MEKDTGKVREFCQSGKVGTLVLDHYCQCIYFNLDTTLCIALFPRPTQQTKGINRLKIEHASDLRLVCNGIV